MSKEEYLHTFIRVLGKILKEESFPVSAYTADDALALRSRLITPLEPNPADNHNTELETLVILIRSLLNHRNEDAEYLAGCYIRAVKLLEKLNPPNAEKEPETYFTVANGDLLYEASKLLETPLNILSARLYGINPSNYIKATTTHNQTGSTWAA